MKTGKVIAGLGVLIAVAGLAFLIGMDEDEPDVIPLPRPKINKVQPKVKVEPIPTTDPKLPDPSVAVDPKVPIEPKGKGAMVEVKKRNPAKKGSYEVVLQVVTDEDKPLISAWIKARTTRRVLPRVYTDKKGEARYGKLEKGEQFIAEVWHPRYKTPRFVGPVAINTRLKLRFPSEAFGTLEANFQDAQGNPLGGGTLRVEDSRGRHYEFRAKDVGINSSGQLEAELSPGRYTVQGKNAKGFADVQKEYVTITEGGHAAITFRFKAKGIITGAVIGDFHGADQLVFEIQRQVGHFKNPYTKTDRRVMTLPSNGRFELKDLDPGKYKIRASLQEKPDQASPWKVLVLEEGKSQDIELELETVPLSAIGHVLDDEGKPVEGVKIRCLTAETSTDEKGEFKLYGLPNGYQVVNFQKTGYARFSRELVVTNTGKYDQTMQIRLSQFGQVTGKIASQTGEALSGVRVILVSKVPGRQGEVMTQSTNEQGWYRFNKVFQGPYYIRVGSEDPHNETGAPHFRVLPGQFVRVPDIRK